jgi:hypothetical protein
MGIGDSVALLDKYTNQSNKLVSKPYSSYRTKNPILEPGLWNSFSGTKDSKKKRMNEHIDFLNELRSEFIDAKKEVEECLENYEFEKNEKKSHEQLDKNYKIDQDKILPESLPRKVRKDLSSKVDDMTKNSENKKNRIVSRFRNNSESDEKEENQKYENMMTSDKLAHFIILHIKRTEDQDYDVEWYHRLQSGHPEQSKDIIEQIEQFSFAYSIHNLIDNLRKEIDCFYLDDIQEEYIKDVTRGNIEQNKTTIQRYKNDNK